MNRYTLNFDSVKKQQQYYNDQQGMLLFFYERVCYFGSISALLVFIIEFFSPIGLGVAKYGCLSIPLVFFATYTFLQKKRHLFNYILPLFNLLIGISFDTVILFRIMPNIDFMAGMTVALVQFSLLLTTNFTLNLLIIMFNFLSMIFIVSIRDGVFAAYQIMLLLAIILMSLSYYSQEYMKREFYLLKERDQKWQRSIIDAFSIQVLKISFNINKNQLVLERSEKIPTAFRIKNSKELVQFLRNSIVQSHRKSSVIGQQINNLENLVHGFLTRKTKHKCKELMSVNVSSMLYRVKLFQTIEAGKKKIILLFQSNEKDEEIKKLNKNIKQLQDQIYSFIKIFKKIIIPHYISIEKSTDKIVKNLAFHQLYSIQEFLTIMYSNYQQFFPKIQKMKLIELLYMLKQQILPYCKENMIGLAFGNVDTDVVLHTDIQLLLHLLLKIILSKLNCLTEKLIIDIDLPESEIKIANINLIKFTITFQESLQQQLNFQVDQSMIVEKRILLAIGEHDEIKQTDNSFSFRIYQNLKILKNKTEM